MREVYPTDQVIHLWAHQALLTARNPAGNVHFNGVELYNYNTTIAVIIDDVVYISDHRMSATTGKHISAARQATRHMQQFYTPAFSWSGSNPRPTHEAMILPAVRDTISTLEQALAAPRTRQQTKCNAIGDYLTRRGQIIALAEQTGTVIPDMPIISHTAEGITAYQAARLKAVKKQQQEDKKQFTAWLTTGKGSCPYSYIRRYATYNAKPETDYITVHDGVIRTSQGAEAPLAHVIKALAFYDARRLPTDADENQPALGLMWREYHTNGHKIPLGAFTLDSIDEAGNVKAGCHYFTAAEIERFRKQWSHILTAQEATP